MEAQFCGILYSKRNLELGYKLKSICRSYGLSLINIDIFSSLIYLLEHSTYDFLFIDCNTIDISMDIINFLNDTHFRGSLRVIFIDSRETEYDVENYTCVKFFDIASVLEREINNIMRQDTVDNRPDNIEAISEEVVSFMLSAGITPKYLGFAYLKDIVLYSLISGRVKVTLSSDIYPIIASKHRTTPQNIERNIRNCLRQATKSSAYVENFSNLLGLHPTNRTFIMFAIDHTMEYFTREVVGA